MTCETCILKTFSQVHVHFCKQTSSSTVLFRDLITRLGCVKLRPILIDCFRRSSELALCLALSGKCRKFAYDVCHSIRARPDPPNLDSHLSRLLEPEPRRRNNPFRASKQGRASRTPGPFGRARLCASDETRR